MPLYEYACEKCGHHLEARQKMSDEPLKLCPSCGAEALQRLVSRSSFALKGSGWYADGYGAKSGGDSGSSSSSSGSSASSSSSVKATDVKSPATPAADAKPAASTPKPDAPKSKDSGD